MNIALKAPTHIDFHKPPPAPPTKDHDASSQHNQSSVYSDEYISTASEITASARGSSNDNREQQSSEQTISARWFSAIRDGKLIPVESMLKEQPDVMDLLCSDPTPFHSMLQMMASDSLGNDTTNMDGLQVAIMEYKNAYARWRLGSAEAGGSSSAASQDKQREQINVREAILSEMLVVVTPQQLDSHRFGYYKNTTLHLAAFFNDNNLVNRLLIQGANPSIRSGMEKYPMDTTTDPEVRSSLQYYIDIAYQQHLQYHDPNLDIAARYAHAHMAQHRGRYNYEYAEAESIDSDEDDDDYDSFSNQDGGSERFSSNSMSSSSYHNRRTYYDPAGIDTQEINDYDDDGEGGGDGRGRREIDYTIHLHPLPSRLSTVIEASCEDDLNMLNGDTHSQKSDNRTINLGPFSVSSMDPISELAEDHSHNLAPQRSGSSMQQPNPSQHSIQQNIISVTATPPPDTPTFYSANNSEFSGSNIRRIESHGSIPSGSEVTTGGETDFYSCNELEESSLTTPPVPRGPKTSRKSKYSDTSSYSQEPPEKAKETETKPTTDTDTQINITELHHPSPYNTIDDKAFSSGSFISYNEGTLHLHGQKKQSNNGDSDEASEDNDNGIDCSGVDDLLDDLPSESGGSGYFNKDEGLTSAVTFYSSQGLGERKISSKKSQELPPKTQPASSINTNPRGLDRHMQQPIKPERLQKDLNSHTAMSIDDKHFSLSSTSSHSMSFSHELYDMIMYKVPQDIRSSSSSAVVASAIALGGHADISQITEKSNTVVDPNPNNSEMSALPQPVSRIGRRKGRGTIERILSSNLGDIEPENNKVCENITQDRDLSQSPSKMSEIPGEDELEDEASSNFDEVGGLSRSSSLSYGPTNAYIAKELMSLPLTVESRDAIITSLVNRLGKGIEKKLQRVVDDELRFRNENPDYYASKDDTIKSGNSRNSMSSVSDILNALLPTVSAGSGGDAAATFRMKYNRAPAKANASNRTSLVSPLVEFFDQETPMFMDGTSANRDPHISGTTRKGKNDLGLYTPRQSFRDGGDLSGSEGDCEDNIDMSPAAIARRERIRSRSRSHSRSRRSSLSSSGNFGSQSHIESSSINKELGGPPAQSSQLPYSPISVPSSSVNHVNSPRKVSPSPKTLQEKTFISSAFGKSPNRNTLSNPSSANSSISSNNGGISKADPQQPATNLPSNGVNRPSTPRPGSGSSSLSNLSAGSPFGLKSNLALNPNVGRVAAVKRQFEQQASANSNNGRSGSSSSSSRSSFSSSRSSIYSIRSQSNSDHQQSPPKNKDHSLPIQKSDLVSRSISPAVLSGTTHSQQNTATKPESTSNALQAQNTSRDSKPITSTTTTGNNTRSQLSSNDSNFRSTTESSTPSIFTSNNTITDGSTSPTSPTKSDKSLPPHFGSPRQRTKRRLSNTLEAIQNSGIVRGRLQVFTASNPLIHEQHTRPRSSNNPVDKPSKHTTTDYSQRGKRFMETDLDMDIAPTSPPAENLPKIPRDPASGMSVDRKASLSYSPILTRTNVDLNELVEASRRESDRYSTARISELPTIASRLSSSNMSRPKLSITSEEWIEMANRSIGDTADQVEYLDEYLPINESEDNSTPEYYRYLKSKGIEDPEAYIDKHGIFGLGASPLSSQSNSGSKNSNEISTDGQNDSNITDYDYGDNNDTIKRQAPQIDKGKMIAINDGPESEEYQQPEISDQLNQELSINKTPFTDRASTSLDRQASGGSNNGTPTNSSKKVTFNPRLVFGLSSSGNLVDQPDVAQPSFATKDAVSRFFSHQQQQSAGISSESGSKPSSGADNNSSKHSSISTIYLQPFEGPSSDPSTPYNTYRGDISGLSGPDATDTTSDVQEQGPMDESGNDEFSTIKIINTSDSDGELRSIPRSRPAIPWLEEGDNASDVNGEDQSKSRLAEGYDKPSSNDLRHQESDNPQVLEKGIHERSVHVSETSSSEELESGREGRSLSDLSTYSVETPQVVRKYASQPPHLSLEPGTDLVPDRKPRVPSFEEEMQHTLRIIEEKAARSLRGSVNAKVVGKFRSKLDGRLVSDNINRIPNPQEIYERSMHHYGGTIAKSSNSIDIGTGSLQADHDTPFINLIDGIPKRGFFALPQPKCQVGYLYLRILSMEDIRLSPEFIAAAEAFYFVIRNGIETLCCTAIPIKNAANGKIIINQEFRISTNPKVSITLFLRVIHKPGHRGDKRKPDILLRRIPPGSASSIERDVMNELPMDRTDIPHVFSSTSSLSSHQSSNGSEAGCLPMLQKLLRSNTRRRGNKRNRNQNNRERRTQRVANSSDSTDLVMQHRSGERRHTDPPHPLHIQTPPESSSSSSLPQEGDGGNRSAAVIITNGQRFPADPTPGNYSSLLMSSGINGNPGMPPVPLCYEQYRQGSTVSAKKNPQRVQKEDTLGCAAINVESMLDEVYLRTLVDGWAVQGTWDQTNKALLQLQMFFVPSVTGLAVENLPPTLSDCSNSIEIINWHNTTYCTGFLSQRGGDTKFWRRRFFKQVGCHLIAFHEESLEPRMFIDLNYATRVIDNSSNAPRNGKRGGHERLKSTRINNSSRNHIGEMSEVTKKTRSYYRHHNGQQQQQAPRRRNTHKRNNSDYSRRDSVLQTSPSPADLAKQHLNLALHANYEPNRQNSSSHHNHYDYDPDNLYDHSNGSSGNDSGVYDIGQEKPKQNYQQFSSSIQSINAPLYHGFSIEFGQAGWVEFYAESYEEKHTWVQNIGQTISHSTKIPHWLIKVLHADLSEQLDVTNNNNNA
ncbi:Bud site selection protein bud4 [Mycoemilia scoparia]|uniref:Bud site selection protein bud4 n=1 Tax=Mycoemilia scoparia TaxID=417184 RepID=A0A9W8A916_9FUNG|nr:Bud site selection protein bud4 [Mycoemilia scoparia]